MKSIVLISLSTLFFFLIGVMVSADGFAALLAPFWAVLIFATVYYVAGEPFLAIAIGAILVAGAAAQFSSSKTARALGVLFFSFPFGTMSGAFLVGHVSDMNVQSMERKLSSEYLDRQLPAFASDFRILVYDDSTAAWRIAEGQFDELYSYHHSAIKGRSLAKGEFPSSFTHWLLAFDDECREIEGFKIHENRNALHPHECIRGKLVTKMPQNALHIWQTQRTGCNEVVFDAIRGGAVAETHSWKQKQIVTLNGKKRCIGGDLPQKRHAVALL